MSPFGIIVAAIATVATVVTVVAVVLVAPATVALATFVVALAVVTTKFLAIDVGFFVPQHDFMQVHYNVSCEHFFSTPVKVDYRQHRAMLATPAHQTIEIFMVRHVT